jgi:hypothetical protein
MNFSDTIRIQCAQERDHVHAALSIFSNELEQINIEREQLFQEATQAFARRAADKLQRTIESTFHS